MQSKTVKRLVSGFILLVLFSLLTAVIVFIWYQDRQDRKERIDQSVMAGEPCEVPCWQGIVPGVSTISEAKEILESIPFIRQDSLDCHDHPNQIGSGRCEWKWTVPPEGAYPWLSWRDNIVVEIAISLYDQTIEEIIDLYGVPDFIYATEAGVPEHWYFRVHLFYPHSGLQISLTTEEYSSKLKPSLDAGLIRLFPPMSIEERIAYLYGSEDTSSMVSEMHKWRGYNIDLRYLPPD